ncbi:MAG: hypothetical protein IIV72_08125 [Alistipes sp.]|nr:hypothetical protein [Alistipes sp.]
MIRLLEAREIDVRIQQVCGTAPNVGAILLLYKDARCDMAILDETFGIYGWQREHSFKEGKNYCKVSIWDDKKQCWIAKEDVGVESNTEEVKGQSSDAFKRACFNIGIGRELYSSPFIYIPLAESEWYKDDKSGKLKANNRLKLRVSKIGYTTNREISHIEIVDHTNAVRYTYGKRFVINDALLDKAERCNRLIEALENVYRKDPDKFILINYMQQLGWEFQDHADKRIYDIFMQHITNKGL